MNLGAADKDKLLRYGVIGAAVLIVCGSAWWQLRTPDAPQPVAAPVVVKAPVKSGPAVANGAPAPTTSGVVTKVAQAEIGVGPQATKVGTTASQYDPTLKMEAMLVTESLRYSGAGRNIFSGSSVPVLAPIPKPIAPVRTVGVVLPVYQAPTGPPPPPPIDLKFFGTETMANGSRQAFLLHGEDVFLATPGTIVQRRYKVGTISASSIEVEDMTNNNKQTLPLSKN